ncbi:hypothetical protein SDC9_93338 [bioreactor metagenome]|uniref:Uncharacterized protein n=1 Tax=bioreactor metagenome TaxID=1076179 RepID=A0A645A6Z1_9ZZZZ
MEQQRAQPKQRDHERNDPHAPEGADILLHKRITVERIHHAKEHEGDGFPAQQTEARDHAGKARIVFRFPLLHKKRADDRHFTRVDVHNQRYARKHANHDANLHKAIENRTA